MEGKRALVLLIPLYSAPSVSPPLHSELEVWSSLFGGSTPMPSFHCWCLTALYPSRLPSGGRKRVTYIASLCNDVTEVKGRWVLLWLCVYLFILGKLRRVAVELVCLSLKRSTLSLVCLKSIHLIPWTESNHKKIMLNGLRDGIRWYHLKVMNHISLPGWLLTWIIYWHWI